MKNYEAVQVKPAKFVSFYSKNEETLSDYLKRISKIPVLSYEEEKTLCKRIKRRRFY